MTEGIEVDFLPVGEGEHSGDAIAIRWRQGDAYRVMVYDGGTAQYGEKLVAHIKTHFGSSHVDFLVNSHPDNDHAGGLAYVIENMTVGQVWMHRPWVHSSKILQYFKDGRITDESLEKRLKQKMAAAYRLEQAALARNVPIYEPFAGSSIGVFKVLSPTKERYVHELIASFEKSPELKKESALEAIFDFGRKMAQYIADAWDAELLPDDVCTSAENESSAILFAPLSGRGVLLTGDAGIDSLKLASAYAASLGIHLPSAVRFIQIPHHGGRHNVSTIALDLVVGERLPQSQSSFDRYAWVSASSGASRHPKRIVTNAFARRGFNVGQTKGTSICY